VIEDIRVSLQSGKYRLFIRWAKRERKLARLSVKLQSFPIEDLLAGLSMNEEKD
jgi:hypothetical protein